MSIGVHTIFFAVVILLLIAKLAKSKGDDAQVFGAKPVIWLLLILLTISIYGGIYCW